MPYIKVSDMAYGRLRAPDLDVMEEFLTRFGMVRAERTNTALYMRGTDPAHHIHVTEKGAPKFVGFAYYAAEVGGKREIAAFVKLRLIQTGPLAVDFAALHRASHHEHYIGVAVVGATITVFAGGATEL